MTFEAEGNDEWSAWRMDRYCGMLHRRPGPAWVIYDADGQTLGTFTRRRDAIDRLSSWSLSRSAAMR